MIDLSQSADHRREGFTLIEILLVVVIIGILAAVAIPNIAGAPDKARRNAAAQGIHVIEGGIDRYEMDVGKLPDSLNELLSSSAKGWDGPYIKKAKGLQDPWGNEYHYTKNGKTYKVVSGGPDGSVGGADDIE